LLIIIGLSGLLIVRFIIGGDEDTWICSNNQWVKHGNPREPQPVVNCGEKKSKQQIFNEAGLFITFEIPPDAIFRKEIADDSGKVRIASFYVESGPSDNPNYQLYAVYQPQETVTESELDKIKTGMSPNSIKEIIIDGYKGIEGLIEISGPKNHFMSAIIKNGKLLTLSTFPPSEKNIRLTHQIISTFKFK